MGRVILGSMKLCIKNLVWKAYVYGLLETSHGLLGYSCLSLWAA